MELASADSGSTEGIKKGQGLLQETLSYNLFGEKDHGHDSHPQAIGNPVK